MPLFSQLIQGSILRLWESLVASLPNVLAAMVVFIVGVAVALVLDRVIIRLVAFLKIDEFLAKLEPIQALEKAGIRVRAGVLLGWIVKWFFVIAALVTVTDIMQWDQVTTFLEQIVLYIPNVIIAVLILLAGAVLGGFVRTWVKSALDVTSLASAGFLASLAKWAVLVFSFMAALVQLGIAPDLIRTLFTGFVAMVALAGGLAFGLGGREHATRLLDQLGKDVGGKSSQ